MIAQDAIGQATLGTPVSAVDLAKRDEELRTLATAIVAIIAAKPKGSALALRWAAWLFRITIGALDSKGEQHPNDLHQRATPFWRMLESLANSAVAKDWNDIGAPDAASEEVLCLLCAKILAASENDTELPDVEPLLRCLPASPEEFLGARGLPTRQLTTLFSTYRARPDGLKFRMLSLLFLRDDPTVAYRDFWKRTLTVRELAEHWQSGEQNDGRSDAKQVLAMVLAIGLSLIDYCAMTGAKNSVEDKDSRSHRLAELFRLVYEALREVQAIELFNHTFWTDIYSHLIIRRAFYENERAGDKTIAAPLSPEAEPTMADMLANVASVTNRSSKLWRA